MSVDAPVSLNTSSDSQSSQQGYGNQQALCNTICAVLPRGTRLTGLEIGCGNGTLSQSITKKRPEIKMTGVDVNVSTKALIPVTKYDGSSLPFADKCVDFVILSDVLHHYESPRTVLKEAARVSRKFVIVKDYVCENNVDRATLRVIDCFDKKGKGAARQSKYFSSAEWQTLFAELGLKPEVTNTKVALYPFPINLVFGRKLHFVTRLSVEKRPGGVDRWLTMSKISGQLRLTSPMR